MVPEAASLLGLAAASRRAQVAAFPRDRAVASRRVLAAVYRRAQVAAFPQDLAAASQLVHVVDCPPDPARGLTRGEMGCCRFQRHRVRCMNEPGDEAWGHLLSGQFSQAVYQSLRCQHTRPPDRQYRTQPGNEGGLFSAERGHRKGTRRVRSRSRPHRKPRKRSKFHLTASTNRNTLVDIKVYVLTIILRKYIY